MTDIQKLINLLQSNNANIRYEACEELRVASSIPKEGIDALKKASQDKDPNVADAARRALTIHDHAQISNRPKEAQSSYNPHIVPIQTVLDESDKIDKRDILELLQKQNELLEKLLMNIIYSLESKNEKTYQFRARIVDIDISISSFMDLMFNWIIASIPFAIVVGFVVFIMRSCIYAINNS